MSCLTTVQARGAFSAARFLQAAATAGQRTGRLAAQLATPGTPCCSTHRSLISRGRGGRQAANRLVRGCINADFYNQSIIFQRFSRSTRLSHLRTAANSKISDFFNFFAKFWRFSKILQILQILRSNRSFFIEIFAEFCRNCGKSKKIAGR